MAQPNLATATDKAVAIKMKALDLFIKRHIEPLSELGDPEKLIAKPYEQWTPQDLTALSQIYGTGNDTVLASLIFRKEYERVTTLEAETGAP